MSDPHSPRPQTEVVYPDAVRTALGLMRSAVLSGESWSVELAAAYEGAVAALPAANPAATADAAWEALKRDIIKSCPDDFPIAILAVTAYRPSIEAAIRSAGTPPASREDEPDFLDGARLEYRECMEVRRLLGYLWMATGNNHLRPVHTLFDADDPIVADVERLAIMPDAETDR